MHVKSFKLQPDNRFIVVSFAATDTGCLVWPSLAVIWFSMTQITACDSQSRLLFHQLFGLAVPTLRLTDVLAKVRVINIYIYFFYFHSISEVYINHWR